MSYTVTEEICCDLTVFFHITRYRRVRDKKTLVIPKRNRFGYGGIKLAGPVIDWVIEYAIFLHGLTQQWRPRKEQNLAQR